MIPAINCCLMPEKKYDILFCVKQSRLQVLVLPQYRHLLNENNNNNISLGELLKHYKYILYILAHNGQTFMIIFMMQDGANSPSEKPHTERDQGSNTR